MTTTARRMDQVGLDPGHAVHILQSVFRMPARVAGPLWPPEPDRSRRSASCHAAAGVEAPVRDKPVFGGARGTVTVRDDFDEPLPDFDAYAP